MPAAKSTINDHEYKLCSCWYRKKGDISIICVIPNVQVFRDNGSETFILLTISIHPSILLSPSAIKIPIIASPIICFPFIPQSHSPDFDSLIFQRNISLSSIFLFAVLLSPRNWIAIIIKTIVIVWRPSVSTFIVSKSGESTFYHSIHIWCWTWLPTFLSIYDTNNDDHEWGEEKTRD